jgi:hypothetical protein
MRLFMKYKRPFYKRPCPKNKITKIKIIYNSKMSRQLSEGQQKAAAAAAARAATRVNPFEDLIRAGKETSLQRKTVQKWKDIIDAKKAKKQRQIRMVQPAIQRARRNIRLAREAAEQHERRLAEDPRYRLRYQMNRIYHGGETLEQFMANIQTIRQTFTQLVEQGVDDVEAFYGQFMEDLQRFIAHMQELLISRSGLIFTGIQVREIKELLDMVADNSGGRIQPIDIELVGPDQEAGRLAAEARLARVDEDRVDSIREQLLAIDRYLDINDELIRELCAQFQDDVEIIARYLSMNDLFEQEEEVEEEFIPAAAVGGAAVGYDARVDQVRHMLEGIVGEANVAMIRQLCDEYQGATVDFIVQKYLERIYAGKKMRKQKRKTVRKAARRYSGKRKYFPKTQKGCRKRKMSWNRKSKRCNLK